ncbi:hypothetical protein EDB84DRAFT_636918 [Lactarius hengduanensis]|nr:hypothetical protein EDB84DRAFT_636918 [Lactarius hengduanensis]
MSILPKGGSYTRTEDQWRPNMMIKFVLLRSPLVALHDPETVIVRQMLSTKPPLSEILWNFSRYKDRARITLEQNPHFYSSLPVDESAYTPIFKRHPLGDLSLALKPHDTVYVLVDRPGHMFLETEGGSRRFGNVWMLNGTLIFKDSSGVLEGEQFVRGTSISGKWRCYEEPKVFPECECPPRLNHSHLRPIITTPSVDPASGMPFDDWAILSHPSSHSINIQIYSTHGRRESTMDLDLPPPPPTSDKPGYQVLYTSINTLNDDTLLGIFNHYLPVARDNWKPRLGWFELAHVCRRWRHLIYESAFHLDAYILCTKGAPVVDLLSLLPPLPLVITYQFTTVRVQDELEISHALRLRNRVRRVSLRIPPSSLRKLLVLLEEPFPRLERLSLSSTFDRDMTLTLPKTFLAPNLRHLKLLGVNLSSELPLPSSTDSLVTLTLENIRDFLPEHLITRLGSFRQLEELSIDFSSPLRHSSAESELLDALETPVTLLKLKCFTFRGISAYLESIIAQIRAPHLEQLNITLFDQVAFALPHLSHFANTTEGLKLPMTEIIFESDAVAVVMNHRKLQLGKQPPSFKLRVMHKVDRHRQIDCAAKICSALMPMLSGAEELALIVWRRYWSNGGSDPLSAMWHKLLRPFIGVKTLHICRNLQQEVARALRADDAGFDPRFLPSLQELVPDISKGYTNSSFTPFIHTRQIAGRPVSVALTGARTTS